MYWGGGGGVRREKETQRDREGTQGQGSWKALTSLVL